MRTRFGSLLSIIYLVIGFFVARAHHYFVHVGSFTSIVSAVLAVLLWPLVLLGVNLHVH